MNIDGIMVKTLHPSLMYTMRQRFNRCLFSDINLSYTESETLVWEVIRLNEFVPSDMVSVVCDSDPCRRLSDVVVKRRYVRTEGQRLLYKTTIMVHVSDIPKGVESITLMVGNPL